MKPYIKRVEIHNYKTHKNTRLIFSPGINSIVGPNGAGKSNIVQAILFCLGERSPKNLRVSSFNEIVYNFRKDLDVSVTLTIVDSKGEEHRFKRIYSPRKGEHIYRYNGKRVSRTAYLLNLLKLGTNGLKHVYIKQGDITRWADATPKDIKEMIHEALGLKEYNQRRREALERLAEAEKKLESVQAQYLRMQDIVYTFRNHMISYETSQTATYLKNTLQNTITKKELEEKEKQLATLKKRKLKVDQIYTKVVRLENEISQKISEYVDRYSNAIRRQTDINAEINRLNTEIIKILDKENSLKDMIRRTRIHEINTRIELRRKEIQRLREEVKTEVKNLKNELKSLKTIEQEAKKLRKEIEKLDSEIAEAEKLEEEIIKQEAEKIEEYRRIISQESEEILREKIKELRRREYEEELRELRRRIEVYQRTINELRRRKEDTLNKLRKLRDELERHRKSMRETERKLKKTSTEVKNAYKLLRKLENILENLTKDKQAEVKYYNDSSKVLEATKTLRITGVYGILSEMVKGPPKILRLIRDLDLRSWYAIIVKDRDTALRVAEIANELEKDISILTANVAAEKTLPDNSVIYLLKYPKKIENIIINLYGDIETVVTLEEALEKTSRGARTIHIDGEFLLHPHGYIRTTGILVKLPKDVETLRIIRDKFRRVIQRKEEELTELENRFREQQREENKIMGRIVSTQLTIKYIDRNIKLLNDISKRLRDKEKKLREELGREKRETGKTSEKTSLTSEIERIREHINELRKRREELRNELSSLEEVINKTKISIQLFQRNIRAKKERIDKLKEEIETLEREKPELKNRIKELAQQIKKLVAQRREYSKKINRLEKELEKIRKTLKNIDERRQRLEQRLAKIREKREKISSIRTKLTTKLSLLEAEVSRLRTIIDKAVGREMEINNLEAAKELVENLRRELEEIGDVSQIAERTFLEQLEPYKNYSTRRHELLKERDEIIEFIRDIDEKRLEIFEEGFRKIRERFIDMFKTVFPDSKVWIELEEEGNIDSGVLVYIEFTGKPRITIAAASGGERTSIILMLLLSIYSINEDTIFIFDEIDAHMDPRVVDNIAKIIKAQEKYSQIILVTLPGHDSMINIADIIIPVTFTRGASKAFSIKSELLAGARTP